MMGLHPCDVKIESMEKELSHVEEMLQKEQFIAERNRTRFILG